MKLMDNCVAGAVRMLNGGGRLLERRGMRVPELNPATLIRAAERRSGQDDFGPWPFTEPFERLLYAYERDAALTTLGRITVRELLVSLLQNLLELEAERKRLPQLEAERIEAPVFIIGLPRTGTTLLHGLMGEDPASRVPRTWEVMFPACPMSTAAELEAARSRAAARLQWANRLVPEFKRIHPIAPQLPQECIAITAQVFVSIQFHTTHDVASYQDWLEADSQDLGYAFHHRILQHLQAKQPGRRWVLKAPGHLFALEALLRRYPDARIIQTHRDPLRVMASMASHATVLRRAFSKDADAGAIAADWARRWAAALDGFLTTRDRFPSGQFLDLSYQDIETAPLEAIEQVYAFLGWPLSDDARLAMTRFLEANPKNKHGVHRYSLSQYGLDRTTELRRFARYCERFDIAVQPE